MTLALVFAAGGYLIGHVIGYARGLRDMREYLLGKAKDIVNGCDRE